MKIYLFVSILILSLVAVATASVAVDDKKAAPADISGKWSMAADAGSQVVDIAVEIAQKGADFTGTSSSMLGNGKIDTGKVEGKKFSAIMHADVQGQAVDFKMEGTVDGDKMTGTLSNANFGSVPFTATRGKK